MAIATDLTGLGTAPALAGKIGHMSSTLTGVGTAQSGAKAITNSVTIGTPTTGNTAYTLPNSTTMLKEFYFFNNAVGADSALIYPPIGGTTLNGSTSGAVTVAQHKGAMFMLVSGSGGTSAVWLTLAGA